MTLIEIDDIIPLPEAAEHLAGSSVERPTVGDGGELWSLGVSGWVLGRHEPVTSVDVVHQHVRVRSAPAGHDRPDVAGSYPEIPHATATGFNLRCGVLSLPPTFVLRLEAGFANGYRIPFALIRGRRQALTPAPAATLHGIAVTALDRSGSTPAMAMLAAHPEVVVGGGFPFGSRPASYWWHMLRVLGEPADHVGSAHPDTYQHDHHWLGAHPLAGEALTDTGEAEAFFGRDYIDRLAAFAAANADDLYGRIAAARGASRARFYAEKHEPGPIPRLLSEVDEGSREILVVRDLRDMACSMLAFGRRRGEVLAGDEEASAEFLVSLAHPVARLVAYARERGEAAHIVRYEDLVTAPVTTLAGILSHVGISARPAVVERCVKAATTVTPELTAHRTSSEVATSIGRYRDEFSPALLEAADAAFGPALDEFGYDRSACAPAAR